MFGEETVYYRIMNDTVQIFRRRLRVKRRQHQCTLLLRESLKIAGIAVLVLLVYVIGDYFFGFSPSALTVINLCLVVGFVLVSLSWLIYRTRYSDRMLASRVDRREGSIRREMLSAHELSSEAADTPGLHEFLVTRSVESATRLLEDLPARVVLPLRSLCRQAFVLVGIVAAVALLLGGAHRVSRVIFSRILDPTADIPPYSALVFNVEPSRPQVLYGGNVDLSVRVSGAKLREPVRLMTKLRSDVREATCFQRSENHYSQRMEGVVEPLAFCFASGRARSQWHLVEVLLEPQISAAHAVITPPEYTKRQPQSLPVGAEGISALGGADIALRLTSNRPLSRGIIRLSSPAGDPEAVLHEGELDGMDTIRFSWNTESSCDIEVTLFDIRGTTNRVPYRIHQELLPDEPPEVTFTEPSSYALVTPSAKVKLAGYAEDDILLRNVELVSALVGYRDRAKTLGPLAPEPRVELDRTLDLAALGAQPGQVMEFYLEATDVNPSLAGIGASEIVRLQVISEEEYAENLRTKIRSEEFAKRYYDAMEALDALKKALENAENMAREGDASEIEIGESLQALGKQAKDTASTFRKISEDFPVFDIEAGFQDVMKNAANQIEQMGSRVQSLSPSSPTLAAQLDAHQRSLGETEQAVAEEAMKAEEVAQVSRVMELALRVQQLVMQQEELVRQVQRYADPATIRDPGLFRRIKERERHIKKEFEQVRDTLQERLEELPDHLSDLRKSARAFARAIDGVDVLPVLEKAAEAAQNLDGSGMSVNATLALERMRELLDQGGGGDPFGGMCKGQLNFRVPDPMRKTLGQMMRSWKFSPGSGSGPGSIGMSGEGFGGSSDSGYSVRGFSPLNMPMYGPVRSTYTPPPGQGVDGGGGFGGDASGVLNHSDSYNMRIQRSIQVDRSAPTHEQAPQKYRDAVKRYFEVSQ